MLSAGCLKSCILLCDALGKGISSPCTDPIYETPWSYSLGHSVGRGRGVLVEKVTVPWDSGCDCVQYLWEFSGRRGCSPGWNGISWGFSGHETVGTGVTLWLLSLSNSLCACQASALGIKSPKAGENDQLVYWWHHSAGMWRWEWVSFIISEAWEVWGSVSSQPLDDLTEYGSYPEAGGFSSCSVVGWDLWVCSELVALCRVPLHINYCKFNGAVAFLWCSEFGCLNFK